MTRKLVCVAETSLIVLMETGVFYTNQTGGVACHHPTAQGILIPIGNTHFTEELVNECQDFGFCGLEEKSVSILQGIINRNGLENSIKIRRNKLQVSEEAWVHVVINDPPGRFPFFKGFKNAKAILTWQNSD